MSRRTAALLASWTALALSCLAALPAGPAHAQQRGEQQTGPPKVEAAALALAFLTGRFHMPVTCTRPDGSLIEREEAIVFRPSDSQENVLRATFFGVDAGDATHCYNLVHARVPDRRGVLYLTFDASRRKDLGVRDFRRVLERGALEYRITGGQLELREIGTGAAPVRVSFEPGGDLRVLDVKRHSDGDKLLTHAEPAPVAGRPVPRRFELEVKGPDSFSVVGHYIEDQRRWK